MKTLIIYESTYGQTKKIAECIKKELDLNGEPGKSNDILEISQRNSELSSLDIYDQVIIGTPVYVSHFPSRLIKWIKYNHKQLALKKVHLFTVSLNAADSRPIARVADEKLLVKFIKASDLAPRFIASFAGSLKYSKYGFFIKFIMKKISESAGGPTDTSRDYELTDWKSVTDFVKTIMTNDSRSKYFYSNHFETPKELVI